MPGLGGLSNLGVSDLGGVSNLSPGPDLGLRAGFGADLSWSCLTWASSLARLLWSRCTSRVGCGWMRGKGRDWLRIGPSGLKDPTSMG